MSNSDRFSRVKDAKTGRIFIHDKLTGSTEWETTKNWQPMLDERSGRVIWYNTQTGHTQYGHPQISLGDDDDDRPPNGQNSSQLNFEKLGGSPATRNSPSLASREIYDDLNQYTKLPVDGELGEVEKRSIYGELGEVDERPIELTTPENQLEPISQSLMPPQYTEFRMADPGRVEIESGREDGYFSSCGGCGSSCEFRFGIWELSRSDEIKDES